MPRCTWEIEPGDVLAVPAEVLICPANPLLRMTGGVNGALLQRGGVGIQRELEAHLRALGRTWVPPGTVVRTGPGPLAVAAILHAVAIDGFYRTDRATVAGTLERALAMAAELGARRVALPALATGYGPLPVATFVEILAEVLDRVPPSLARVTLVLRRAADAEAARAYRDARVSQTAP